MKIYISGSTGMVGKNLLEHPQINKYEIIESTRKEVDLTDYKQVFYFLKNQNPDFIIHCAGQVGGIQANMKDLYGFFTNNMLMGMNLVRAAKELNIKNFLNLSSSCAYPWNAENPLREEMLLTGQPEPTNEGYAIAKIAVMKMCEYISKEYSFFNYKTMIPCNLYGRFDKFEPKHSHMIPAVIRKIHNAKVNSDTEVEIWGDGEARREFMYVGELADAIAFGIQNFESMPNCLNVGLGYDYSINQYYETIAKIIGFEGTFKHDLSKPVGMNQKLLDISRQKSWGWKSQMSLEEGIKKTYEFFLNVEVNKDKKICQGMN